MNPQITALYELQQRDRHLSGLERKLQAIPLRLRELDDDLAKLEAMLDAERRKCDETREFERGQKAQLADEEELVRQSKAKINQVKNARELNATQRELDSTRRMMTTRSDEIKRLQQGVEDAEQRIQGMQAALEELRASAEVERTRLQILKGKVETKLGHLRASRTELTVNIEPELLRSYERIRPRRGGMAFVPAENNRCTACKIAIPHQLYVQLCRGEEIPTCESCGRLLYWPGHFPEHEKNEPAPKPRPAVRKPAAKD